MTNQEALSTKLLERLRKIDFDRRYFDYYRVHADRENSTMRTTRADLEAVLSDTPLNFKYYTKENFFQHKERHPRCELVLNIAFPYSTAEFILHVRTNCGPAGGPYPLLARQVATMRDPDFVASPRSPKLPFSNAIELKEVVQFGLSLFEDAKRAILPCEDWVG
jgi:hypothetical protein